MSVRKWTYRLLTDEALLSLYAGGEAMAFDILYRRHKRPLYLYLLRHFSDRAICEDLVSETWMAVIQRAAQFERKAKFKTWLFRIGHNRLIDHQRGAHTKASFSALAEELLQKVPDTASAEDGIKLSELAHCIESLSPIQTSTLLLKIEGFSREEISQITGSRPETVKSRLRHARNLIKSEAVI